MNLKEAKENTLNVSFLVRNLQVYAISLLLVPNYGQQTACIEGCTLARTRKARLIKYLVCAVLQLVWVLKKAQGGGKR